MYRRYPPLRDQLKEPLTLMMLAAFAVVPLLAGVLAVGVLVLWWFWRLLFARRK